MRSLIDITDFTVEELDELLALGEGGIRTLMDLQRETEKNS